MPILTTIGAHRVQHGDLVRDGVDALMEGQRAHLTYVDLPWGNVAFWHTLNRKMTGDEPADGHYSQAEFLRVAFDTAARYTSGLVFIEYGQKWVGEILAAASAAGLASLALVKIQYKSGSQLLPHDLHIFRPPVSPIRTLTEPYLAGIAGTHGYQTLQRAVTPFARPGELLLDFCCGLGYSAQIALDTGMIFRGNELNGARLAKTIARLTRHA